MSDATFSQRISRFYQSVKPKRIESVQETITLSPWEKFLKYRKFPWKMVTEILIVIFVILQVRNHAYNVHNERFHLLHSTGLVS